MRQSGRVTIGQLAWMLPLVLVVGYLWPGATGPADVEGAAAQGAPPQSGSVDRARVLRGRALVLEHGCGDCHGGSDNPGSPVWLQGMRDTLLQQFTIPTPIGTFKTRARNLTPDNTTGIGRFSERQIFNALRYGLRPGETPDVQITATTPGQGNFPRNPKFLAPPMPWPAFRHMQDQDIRDIAYYLKNGLKPVRNLVPDSEGPADFWAGIYSQITGTHPAPAFPTANERSP